MIQTGRWAVLALFALLLTGCASLRLVRVEREVRSYFPLASGAEAEYALVTTVARSGRLDTTTRARYFQQVTGTERMADGATAFRRIWRSEVTLIDTILAESTFRQSETSFFRPTRSAVLRYSTPASRPDTILRFPLAVDLRWKSSDIHYWVMSRDDLLIAGRSCPGSWRVKTFSDADATPVNSWFAAGIGLVRLVTERDLGGRLLRTEYWLVRSKVSG